MEPGNKRQARPEVSIKFPLHGGKDYSFGVARVVYYAWYPFFKPNTTMEHVSSN